MKKYKKPSFFILMINIKVKSNSLTYKFILFFHYL